MEDILASIRRIIADDQTQGTRAPAAPRRAAAPATKAERPAEYGEVHDLGRMPPAATMDRGQPVRVEAAPVPMRPAPASEPAPVPEEVLRAGDRGRQTGYPGGSPQPYVNGYSPPTLVRDQEQAQHGSGQDRYQPAPAPEPSRQVDTQAIDDGLMTPALGTSVMSAFETLAATVVLQNSDLLDRVMRELMRPLIKTWLDENLPSLVERLVRSEIERMARGNTRN